MKKWKWLLALTILIALGGIVWTVFFKTEELPILADESEFTIGLSFDSLVVERWQRDMETIVSYANEKEIQVNVQVANDDVDLQKKQIRDLIELRVDLLVILPGQYDAFEEELRMAEKEGIKVIAYDRLLTGGHIDLYLSFDNKVIGENLATEVIEGIQETTDGKKNIVIVNGDPGDFNSQLINEGIKSVIENAESDSINILGEVWATGWREGKAFATIEEILNQGLRIDGVIAANDTLATGVIQALAERSLAGKVVVAGQDAELSACQRIVEGTQQATIYKPINAMSGAAVDYGLLLMQDQSFEYQETIENEYLNQVVPYVKLNSIVVTRTNMDEVIVDSGFHNRESVYMNAEQ